MAKTSVRNINIKVMSSCSIPGIYHGNTMVLGYMNMVIIQCIGGYSKDSSTEINGFF